MNKKLLLSIIISVLFVSTNVYMKNKIGPTQLDRKQAVIDFYEVVNRAITKQEQALRRMGKELKRDPELNSTEIQRKIDEAMETVTTGTNQKAFLEEAKIKALLLEIQSIIDQKFPKKAKEITKRALTDLQTYFEKPDINVAKVMQKPIKKAKRKKTEIVEPEFEPAVGEEILEEEDIPEVEEPEEILPVEEEDILKTEEPEEMLPVEEEDILKEEKLTEEEFSEEKFEEFPEEEPIVEEKTQEEEEEDPIIEEVKNLKIEW